MVCELEFGAAIACCINIRVSGLELLVHLDAIVQGELHVSLL